MGARIYVPAKTAMQSGKGKSSAWVLEYDQEKARQVEPMMGYTSSSDMRQQVRLSFASRQEAIAYAERSGIDYHVVEPVTHTPRRASYSDNFRSARIEVWTH